MHPIAERFVGRLAAPAQGDAVAYLNGFAVSPLNGYSAADPQRTVGDDPNLFGQFWLHHF